MAKRRALPALSLPFMPSTTGWWTIQLNAGQLACCMFMQSRHTCHILTALQVGELLGAGRILDQAQGVRPIADLSRDGPLMLAEMCNFVLRALAGSQGSPYHLGNMLKGVASLASQPQRAAATQQHFESVQQHTAGLNPGVTAANRQLQVATCSCSAACSRFLQLPA